MTTTTMMKCKKHPYEKGVGVCATCLRERLLELVAEQSGRTHHAAQLQPSAAVHSHQQLREQQLPPPLVFPRSVSPYVARRRSVDLDFRADVDADADPATSRRQRFRFFSTPQVGPDAGRRKPAGRTFLASLFAGVRHSRSEEVEPDCVASGPTRGSSSWFSSLLPGRKKHQQKKKKYGHFEEEDAEENRTRRKAWYRGRGISPAKDVGGVADDDSGSESGYTTESSAGGWRLPAPTPMRKNFSPAHRAMSGFVVCLSPLVRATPQRSQAGEGGGAAGMSGELRSTGGSSLRRRHHHRHRSGGGGPPTLRPNRSRKLADLGRFQ